MFLSVIHINNYGANVESISKTICVVLYFQKGHKICEILDNAMCSGSILMYVLILWLWIVLVLLYRVQGHAWSHTLYGIVMYELLKFEKHYFIYHLFLLISFSFHQKKPGPRLNIKTVLSTYGDFHVKDKTAVRTSYL